MVNNSDTPNQVPVQSSMKTGDLPWWYAIFVDAIGKVGFPIVVTVWLLFHFDAQIQALIQACSQR